MTWKIRVSDTALWKCYLWFLDHMSKFEALVLIIDAVWDTSSYSLHRTCASSFSFVFLLVYFIWKLFCSHGMLPFVHFLSANSVEVFLLHILVFIDFCHFKTIIQNYYCCISPFLRSAPLLIVVFNDSHLGFYSILLPSQNQVSN